MFRKGFLWIGLLAVALVATTTVHARELPGVGALECSGALHVEAESESAPVHGDSDKGTVHHHGCHSASTLVARSPVAAMIFALPAHFYPALRVVAYLPRQSGPGLRPPIA